MSHTPMNRRMFTTLMAGCAVGGGGGGCAADDGDSGSGAAAERAYVFLDRRVDEAAGAYPGLPRSYTGGAMALHHSKVAFTYDVAVMIIAYCKRGREADLTRAGALGRTLLELQDGEADGRLRQAYTSGKLPPGQRVPEVDSAGTFTGTSAWAGLALLHLHHATGASAYRAGALRLGRWIQERTYRAEGVDGYTGGFDSGGTELRWKSTEHHVDVSGFFRGLAGVSGDAVWDRRADTAAAFLDAVWDGERGAFWTGTGTDGVTVNRSPVPEDPQTWSYLATRDVRHARSVDWALTGLAASDGGFSGVSVSDADRSKVWFEGTAHLVCALRARRAAGDDERAGRLLESLRSAQTDAPHADGYGLVAASSDGLETGDGDTLYASLHTGTTAWFALAARGANPFALGGEGSVAATR
ncbi:Tat pathway signal sequence domain protein [Streptomyces sp. NPDC002530]